MNYASEVTKELWFAAQDRTDVAKARASMGNRRAGEVWDINVLRTNEEFSLLDDLFKKTDAKLSRLLRQHELWPFLEPLKGLRGTHVALILAGVRHPMRFPGQRCSEGHYLTPDFEIGAPCSQEAWDDEGVASMCTGTMLSPRPHTGVKSLWHYLGLGVDDGGRSPHKQKGVQLDYNTKLRTSVLMPDAGIAAMIVKQRTPIYRDVYDMEKARLIERGPLRDSQAKKDAPNEMRLGWADHTARKIAAKRFLGDMLIAWKDVVVAA